MKRKIYIIPAFLILVISSYFVLNSFNTVKTEPPPAPYFNVRVLQFEGSSPQVNAEVVYKQNGNQITSGISNSDGWVFKSLNSGTYDVYVYYPARPNDQQSGQLLNHYYDVDEEVNITF